MSDYTVELSGDAQDQISGIYRHIRDGLCNLSAAESFLDDTEAESVPLNGSLMPTW